MTSTICDPLIIRCKQESSSPMCMNTFQKNYKEKRRPSLLKPTSITRSGMVHNVQPLKKKVKRLKWVRNTKILARLSSEKQRQNNGERGAIIIDNLYFSCNCLSSRINKAMQWYTKFHQSVLLWIYQVFGLTNILILYIYAVIKIQISKAVNTGQPRPPPQSLAGQGIWWAGAAGPSLERALKWPTQPNPRRAAGWSGLALTQPNPKRAAG